MVAQLCQTHSLQSSIMVFRRGSLPSDILRSCKPPDIDFPRLLEVRLHLNSIRVGTDGSVSGGNERLCSGRGRPHENRVSAVPTVDRVRRTPAEAQAS
jgi:hypothetical protein